MRPNNQNSVVCIFNVSDKVCGRESPWSIFKNGGKEIVKVMSKYRRTIIKR